LITTPVVEKNKIIRLLDVARRARIAVVADDAAAIHALGQAVRQAGVHLSIVAEVDVGQGRCGVPPGDAVVALARAVQDWPDSLRWTGVQGYQGRLQNLPSFAERETAVKLAMEKLQGSLQSLRQAGLSVPVITGGGTGSAPIDFKLKVLTELQPGSYISMDRAYAATEWDDRQHMPPFGQPLLVLASVLSRPEANRVVIDVGWKSINSDGAAPVVWQRPDLQFEFAGDEHALLRSAGAIDLSPGDRVLLMPGHCDTTVNLYDAFTVHRDGELEGRWPIEARGKSQ
jgi:D-serine deaminase-like pyridoxal phosphate-dependent protein